VEIETLDAAKTVNLPLVVDVLRRKGNKNKALLLLQKGLASNMPIAYAIEIINTYIYFKDFEGALKRFESFIYKNVYLDKLKLLIEIHVMRSKGAIECGGELFQRIKEKVLEFLRENWCLDLYEFLWEFSEGCCKVKATCVRSVCKFNLENDLRFILKGTYVKKMSYGDLCVIAEAFDVYTVQRRMIYLRPPLSSCGIKSFFKKYGYDDKLAVRVLEHRYIKDLYPFIAKRGLVNESIGISRRRAELGNKPTRVVGFPKMVGGLDKPSLKAEPKIRFTETTQTW
jgi:hypothetical protein